MDRGHEVDPSDGASIASTVDDSMDEDIADIDDTAVAESRWDKWDAAVLELTERFAVVAVLVRIDTAGHRPDWAASFAGCADSPLVPAAAELVCSGYLVHSDAVASSDSVASPADGDCVEWA